MTTFNDKNKYISIINQENLKNKSSNNYKIFQLFGVDKETYKKISTLTLYEKLLILCGCNRSINIYSQEARRSS
jgi:hypothetical protein